MRLKGTFTMLILMLASLLYSACGQDADNQGSAHVGVSTRALQATDVDRVSITVSGSHFAPDIVHDLVLAGSTWKGTIGKIPVGSCSFTARAYDTSVSSTVPVYEGSVTASVTKGSAVNVVILLQQRTAPTPFSNDAPRITGLTASSTAVVTGASVSLNASASDPDSDPLTYQWSTAAGCGSFSPAGPSATANSSTWTAPAAAPAGGSCALKVTVTDGKGGQSELSLAVSVSDENARGSASFSLSFNTSPTISALTVANGQLAAGASTAITVSASDPDSGTTLSYAWTDTCTGSFASSSAASTTWTAPATAPSGNTCTLTVTVSDGAGAGALSTTGSVTVTVGNTATTNEAPVIDSSMQTDTTVSAGASVTLRVVAHDPESQALSFTWTAASGTLGTASTTSSAGTYASLNTWTAPTGTGTYTIGVSVSDGSNSTSLSFSVMVGGSSAWARSAGGSTSSDFAQATGIAVDNSGNLYLAGFFEGAATFGTLTTLTSAGLEDIFIAKLDSAGAWLWARKVGSTSTDRGYGVALDSSGDVYLTGYFSGTVSFGTLSTLTSAGYKDIFVAKLNSAGTWLWARNAGGTDSDRGAGVAVDGSGTVSITGEIQNTATFGTLSALTSSGGRDIFVAQISSAGAWQWASHAGGSSSYATAKGIGLDSTGGASITGYFGGTATFGTLSALTASGITEIFVAQISSAGAWQWAKRAGGSSGDSGNGIVVDSSGDVYLTGNFFGVASFGTLPALTSAGISDIFVAKLNSVGAWQWAMRAGGGGSDAGHGIAVDSGGDVHLTGHFISTATFGTLTPLTSAGNFDIFVVSLDSTGSWQSATSGGGSTSYDGGYCIAINGGVPHVAGHYFSSTMTLGSTTLTNTGGSNSADTFIWKNP